MILKVTKAATEIVTILSLLSIGFGVLWGMLFFHSAFLQSLLSFLGAN